MNNDLAFVAIMIAFFAVSALFVIACDKIIGSDDQALAIGGEELSPEPEPEEVAA